MEVAEQRLADILTTLAAEFGDLGWWPARSQFEICIGAILTQNTVWTNVERALANLHADRITSIDTLLGLPLPRLEQLIRPSGYYRQKAKKLRAFCKWLQTTYQGNYLAAGAQPTAELRRQLLNIWGIGPETADALLCYAFGKPVFVVDAYLYRILRRHQIIPQNMDYKAAQKLVSKALPRQADYLGNAHAWIVETGKRWCHRRNPDCKRCPLQQYLPED